MSKSEEVGRELVVQPEGSIDAETGLAELIQHFLLAQDIKPSSKGLYRRGLRLFLAWLKEQEHRQPTRFRQHWIGTAICCLRRSSTSASG